jgi:ankyrin repeat protein
MSFTYRYSFFCCAAIDIDQSNAHGQSALHVAANNRNVAACRLLISHGASPDIRDSRSCTPLHLAIAAGSEEVSLILIRDGLCELDIQNSDGLTPIKLAIRGGLRTLAVVLRDSGAIVDSDDINALPSATAVVGEETQPATFWLCHSEGDYPSGLRLQKELGRRGIRLYAIQCPPFTSARTKRSTSQTGRWKNGNSIR